MAARLRSTSCVIAAVLLTPGLAGASLDDESVVIPGGATALAKAAGFAVASRLLADTVRLVYHASWDTSAVPRRLGVVCGSTLPACRPHQHPTRPCSGPSRLPPRFSGESRSSRKASSEQATVRFREATRHSSDFFAAVVYLGACYAAGGKDREAAGAWQTALLDDPPDASLHALLLGALLCVRDATGAERRPADVAERWPASPGFVEARVTLDFAAEKDRERAAAYAERYRKLGGPEQALADRWIKDM